MYLCICCSLFLFFGELSLSIAAVVAGTSSANEMVRVYLSIGMNLTIIAYIETCCSDNSLGNASAWPRQAQSPQFIIHTVSY
jgi:hypothetical protein